MIYSLWRPARGGYDYYAASDRAVPLGNDLPVPSLPAGTEIGVASTECGRPMPSGATKVGSGDVAAGLLSPVSRSSLGFFNIPSGYLTLALGIVAGWWLARRRI